MQAEFHHYTRIGLMAFDFNFFNLGYVYAGSFTDEFYQKIKSGPFRSPPQSKRGQA